MANVQRTPPPVGAASKNTPLATKRLRTDDQNWQKTDSTESDVNVHLISLEGMMRTMMQQFTETRQLIDTVRCEIKDVNSKIDSVKTELKMDIKSVRDECAAKLHHYDVAMKSLNTRMDSASQKIGVLQNRNELIISGIPFKTGENLYSTLSEIGRYLDVTDNPMAEIRRMKSGSNSNADRGGLIVVEFALKTTRDEFYSAYLRKRDLKLRHIGLDSDRRVYINESLVTETRKLKSAALHLKKAGKLASVHTKQGVVHVKPTASGPTIAIKSEDELVKYS